MVLPQKVEALSGLEVCAVAAAGGASCAVTAAGELYTWGSGYRRRLGHGDSADQVAPKRVEAPRDEWLVAVALGLYHTIVATRDGSVFGWGVGGGLCLSEAAASEHDENGILSVVLPNRYPQLTCVLRS